jgi:hypothetical protein
VALDTPPSLRIGAIRHARKGCGGRYRGQRQESAGDGQLRRGKLPAETQIYAGTIVVIYTTSGDTTSDLKSHDPSLGVLGGRRQRVLRPLEQPRDDRPPHTAALSLGLLRLHGLLDGGQ